MKGLIKYYVATFVAGCAIGYGYKGLSPEPKVELPMQAEVYQEPSTEDIRRVLDKVREVQDMYEIPKPSPVIVKEFQ